VSTEASNMDITDRGEAAITAGINRILHDALFCQDEEELGMTCLNVALELTGSWMGFINDLSTPESMDSIAIKAEHFEPFIMSDRKQKQLPRNLKTSGLRGRVVREGRAMISNLRGSDPDSIALPEGHPPVTSFMGVPLFEDGRIVGIIGLANKAAGYDQVDLCIMEKLAPSIVQVLMRRRAQQELRKAHDLLEVQVQARTRELHYLNQSLTHTIESITDAFFTLDRDWTVTYWNQAAEKIFGQRVQDVVGRNLWDLFPCAAGSETYIQYHRAMRDNVPVSFETWAVYLGIGVEARAYPSPTGLTIYLKDITERIKAEQALQESEKKFEKVFHNSPDMIAIVSMEDNRFMDVNQSFLEIMGYSRDDVIGRTPQELDLWPDDRKTIIQFLAGLNENGMVKNNEVRIRNKSGNPVSLQVSAVVVTLNKEDCMAATMRDLTRQKTMEAELARLDRLHLIGQMAAGIGHEIRNPMTTVRGFLQLLGGKPEYAEDLAFFELMIEELDRANAIISEYLGMARDKMVDLQPGSLDSVVKSLYPMIMSDANLREIHVKLDLQEPVQTLFDENEIRQLILNISRNAMEAMSSHGTLTIGTRQEGEKVVLYIRDEGSGLSPEIIDKLGTPFVTTKDTGTGLGLAICYSIAARHHARIEYETGPAGTTFYVRFPNAVKMTAD